MEKDKDKEEKQNPSFLAPNSTVPYEEKEDYEEKENNEEAEFYHRKGHVPHFLLYREKLISKFINEIEQFTELEFPKSHNFFPELSTDPFLTNYFKPEFFVSEDRKNTFKRFIQEIVKAGFKKQAIDYLDKIVKKNTLQIEQHDFSNGKVTPTVFGTTNQAELFWSDIFDFILLDQEERIITQQRLEVDRLFLNFLVDFSTILFVERENLTQQMSNTVFSNNKAEKKRPGEVYDDGLLRCDYRKEQVLEYFMQLAHKNYYTEEQVWQLLKSNFRVFLESDQVFEKVKLPRVESLPQNYLMYFVYQFYFHQPSKMFNKERACQFLFDNFKYFEVDKINFKTVYNNMQIKPKNGYGFSDAILR
ncbi:hypothetical protein AHMF7605_11275 [Adhaeribacter arboris]|uniref:Uncharacterized protein n=1 Tax=Adhaeribacter arboris TaxID=2072846 RepID=A0A2T2YEX1_9BACT|nr:hypothetical protein [Adhaeribacter arboris]PSR54059.1 hypothetical protein AHMF7605_11275 [Adhaeribacter arboris]